MSFARKHVTLRKKSSRVSRQLVSTAIQRYNFALIEIVAALVRARIEDAERAKDIQARAMCLRNV